MPGTQQHVLPPGTEAQALRTQQGPAGKPSEPLAVLAATPGNQGSYGSSPVLLWLGEATGDTGAAVLARAGRGLSHASPPGGLIAQDEGLCTAPGPNAGRRPGREPMDGHAGRRDGLCPRPSL